MAPKRKAKAATKPSFDEAALNKLTATIDTHLSKPKKDERPGKRKRDDSKDANPKKRQAQEAKHTPTKPKKEPKKSSQDKKAELLEEIKALGGDEADLDLVAGIDSDVEEGQEAKPSKPAPADLDKALKNELASFAAGLGFDNVRDEDGATDDEIEEEPEAKAAVEEEEWEDEPQEEAESESSEEEEEAPPAEKSQGRSAAGKLVSMRHLCWSTFDDDSDH